jgi:hypothetical protein
VRVGAVNSDHDESINIEPSQVERLTSACALLEAVAGVEDKWDIHTENYRELELAWLETSLNDSIFASGDIAQIYSVNRMVVRRLLNMLSSALLYRSHLKGSISRQLTFCKSEVKFAILRMEAQRTVAIVDALRNFLQHRDVPVGITKRMDRTKPVADSDILYSTHVEIIVKKMLEEPRLPHRVKKLLRAEKLPRKPLNRLVREYVEILWDVHDRFRKACAAQVQAATMAVTGIIDQIDLVDPRFRASKHKLFMVLDDLNSKDPNQLRMFSNSAILNWNHLVSKNKSLRGLHRRIVIGDVPIN